MQRKIKNIFENKVVFFFIGMFNVLLFHFSIYRLWCFLYQTSGRQSNLSLSSSITQNLFLIAFFSIPHSFLLCSKAKAKIVQFLPTALYGTLYSIHACIAILLLDNYWTSFGERLFSLSKEGEQLFNFLYLLSWVSMFYSMLSTGLFKQSGIIDWWNGLRGKKLKNALPYSGAYSVCRHPIYASFLGMIWLSPNMTHDHLLLSLSWTVYIFIGMILKEKRLRRNARYRIYAKGVPMLPLLPRILDVFFLRLIKGRL